MTRSNGGLPTLAELLSEVGWSDVKAALCSAMREPSERLASYRELRRRLQKMEAVPSELAIDLERVGDGDEEPAITVDGVCFVPLDEASLEVSEEIARQGKSARFALDFCPWSEWLGMVVTHESRDQFTPAEIVAACLWEMTAIAFDESSIQRFRDEVMKEMDREAVARHPSRARTGLVPDP